MSRFGNGMHAFQLVQWPVGFSDDRRHRGLSVLQASKDKSCLRVERRCIPFKRKPGMNGLSICSKSLLFSKNGVFPRLERSMIVVSYAACAESSDSGHDSRNRNADDDREASSGNNNWKWYDDETTHIKESIVKCCDGEEMLGILQKNAQELQPGDVGIAWRVVAKEEMIKDVDFSDAKSSRALVDELLHQTEIHARNMRPADVSNCAWALVSCHVESQRHMHLLLKQAENKIVSFTPTELCVCLWAAANCSTLSVQRRESLFKNLDQLVANGMRLDKFDSHDLSILVCSMGKIQMAQQPLLNTVTDVCTSKAGSFSPSDSSRILLGYSMLHHNPVSFIPGLMDKCTENIDHFSADDISVLFLALGRLCIEPDGKFMRAAYKHAGKLAPVVKKKYLPRSENTTTANKIESLEVLSPRQMTRILWSLARLQYRVASDHGIAAQCLKHLSAFCELYEGEEIGAILWAANRLNLKVSIKSLKAATMRIRSQVATEKHSVLINAFRDLSCLSARAGRPIKHGTDNIGIGDLGIELARKIAPSSNLLSSLDIATLIIALGSMEARDLGAVTVELLETSCTSAVAEMPARYLPKISWAIVRLRWNNAELHDAIARSAADRCAFISPEGLSQLAWSFATFERPFPTVFDSLAKVCSPKLDEFHAKDQVRLAWAFAHFEGFHRYKEDKPSFLKQILRSIRIKEALGTLDASYISIILWSIGKCEQHPGAMILDSTLEFVAKNPYRFTKDHLNCALTAHRRHHSKNIVAIQAIKQALLCVR